MRKHGRTDSNHQEVVKALRQAGISAWSTASLGNGFPDVIAARRQKTVLLEVKDGTKPLNERRCTMAELKFQSHWEGQHAVVYSAEEAVKYVLENT